MPCWYYYTNYFCIPLFLISKNFPSKAGLSQLFVEYNKNDI